MYVSAAIMTIVAIALFGDLFLLHLIQVLKGSNVQKVS